jgi:hypothetical protein
MSLLYCTDVDWHYDFVVIFIHSIDMYIIDTKSVVMLQQLSWYILTLIISTSYSTTAV